MITDCLPEGNYKAVLPTQYEQLEEVPYNVIRRWLKVHAPHVETVNKPASLLRNIYKRTPLPITARHHFVIAHERFEHKCCGCVKAIKTGSGHLMCTRCGLRGHEACAKKLHPKNRQLVKPSREEFRHMAYQRVCGTQNIVIFDTSSEACDLFGFYHGQRVLSIRGSYSGQYGSIVGVGREDKKLYCHWESNDSCQALFAGHTGTQNPEDLQRCHCLCVVGVCAAEGRFDPRRDSTYSCIDQILTGVKPGAWMLNPKKKCCPRCHQPFQKLTKCIACRTITFVGREYTEKEWETLEESIPYNTYLASHDNERSSIHGAVELGELKEVKLLVQNCGMSVEATTPSLLYMWRENLFRVPLHVCVLSHLKNRSWQVSHEVRLHEEDKQVKMIRLLIELGADINRKDATGKTALHLAAEFMSMFAHKSGSREDYYLSQPKDCDPHEHWPAGVRVLHTLIQLGADPALRTLSNERAIDLAMPIISQRYPQKTQERLKDILNPSNDIVATDIGGHWVSHGTDAP